MKTLLWSVPSAVVLVEILALSFRMDYWRNRANNVEHAALTYAETQDEHSQERLILSAALNLLGLIIYIWGILALFYLVLEIFPEEAKLRENLFLWSTSAAFIAYAWLRATWLEKYQYKVQQHDNSTTVEPKAAYNRISRWLHWMALEIGMVRRASLELEKILFLKKATRDPRIIDQPVYVMGLARSGTTVVLEILESTGAFHSPTYRDMPFVLCPNLWKGLTKHSRLNAHTANRAHGDGILVGFDSPESFEEVFWRTACEAQAGKALAYATPSKNDLDDFAAYRRLCVLSALSQSSKLEDTAQQLRYLSKNNNNVLRLHELSSLSGAHLVLIIRDPLATAWSLYKMHKRFTQLQSDDAFVRAYMRWLGHLEFGLGHKPLINGVLHLNGLNPEQTDYWLAYWLGIYQNIWNVYEKFPLEHRSRILWMSHERLRQTTAQELARLFNFAKIDHEVGKYVHNIRAVEKSNLNMHFDKKLTEKAYFIEQKILDLIYS